MFVAAIGWGIAGSRFTLVPKALSRILIMGLLATVWGGLYSRTGGCRLSAASSCVGSTKQTFEGTKRICFAQWAERVSGNSIALHR